MAWLMRPAAKGMCKYESLIDGTFDLNDVTDMNDYLDMLDENERRYIDWKKSHG